MAHTSSLRLAYRRNSVKATAARFFAGKMRRGKRRQASIVLPQVIG
jgi:hypothetical protein